MPLSGVPFDTITDGHLQALIDDGVSEGRRIEFKEKVGARDEDKREFLADVSSFANAGGGDLLVGISDSGGVASALVGMSASDTDGEVLRLENVIRDGVEPRIPGIATRRVELSGKTKVVLLIRIPRSWSAPHMVTFRGHSRFYSRTSAGKYPLDVAEIRAAFVGSETGRAQLRSFRSERLGRILGNDGPIQLEDNPKTVLHLIPLSALEGTERYDVTKLAMNYNNPNFWPLTGRAMNHRINYEGAVAWAPWKSDEPAMAYTQVFHTGAIEGVESFMLRREYLGRENPIPSIEFERSLIAALTRYLALAQDIGAPPPYVVALSLLGVRGMTMAVSERFFDDVRATIDRDDLVIPETLVEDSNTEPHKILRPLFDSVWNAVGWPASPYYSEDGEWKPPG